MKCPFCDQEEVLFRPGVYTCDCLSVGLYRKVEYVEPLPYKPKRWWHKHGDTVCRFFNLGVTLAVTVWFLLASYAIATSGQ